jgi:hypothetical protein
VQDALVVRGGEAGAQLPRDVERLLPRQVADATEQRGERLAVHVLHRQVVQAIGVADVVDAADVGMRHAAREPHLAGEPRRRVLAVAGVRGQQLERDRLIEPQVVGAIYLAHRAASEQADDAVAAGEDVAGREPRLVYRGRF